MTGKRPRPLDIFASDPRRTQLLTELGVLDLDDVDRAVIDHLATNPPAVVDGLARLLRRLRITVAATVIARCTLVASEAMAEAGVDLTARTVVIDALAAVAGEEPTAP